MIHPIIVLFNDIFRIIILFVYHLIFHDSLSNTQTVDVTELTVRRYIGQRQI